MPEIPASAHAPNAHATSVPPPVKIAATWPSAASTAMFTPVPVPIAPAREPASGNPEKPEPSIPVSIPMIVIPKPIA